MIQTSLSVEEMTFWKSGPSWSDWWRKRANNWENQSCFSSFWEMRKRSVFYKLCRYYMLITWVRNETVKVVHSPGQKYIVARGIFISALRRSTITWAQITNRGLSRTDGLKFEPKRLAVYVIIQSERSPESGLDSNTSAKVPSCQALLPFPSLPFPSLPFPSLSPALEKP